MNDHTAPTKRCKKCGVEYPATAEYFYKGGTGNRYLRGECKKCRDAYVQEWCDANRARRREIVNKYDDSNQEKIAAWRIENAEHLKAYHHQRYIKNKREIDAKNRAWVVANPEKRKEHVRRWYEANRDRALAYKNRRRAREMAAEGTYSAQDIREIYASQRGRCWWCGCEVGTQYHVDHRVPLSRGGSNNPENLVVSCPTCNLKKNDRYPHEWIGRLL